MTSGPSDPDRAPMSERYAQPPAPMGLPGTSKAGDAGGERRVYLVGGGIASLSAAAFLIRDGDVQGSHITILEQLETTGGSLDGSGSPEAGYVLRGGRMFESHYQCTFDLFASIPTLDETRTVTEETLAWNQTLKTSSKSRLFRNGVRQTAPAFGLTEGHILTIERLALEPEGLLGETSIDDQFEADFFKTDFWVMWSTTFAFQPWHSAVEFKRYLVRFAHMVDGFDRLKGILRTVYNQYDSLVRPLVKWLEARGVRFELNVRVTDLQLEDRDQETRVRQIVFERKSERGEIHVGDNDLVFVTLGCMTEASSLGAMDRAPSLLDKTGGGAWSLWESLAAGRAAFGDPSVFADHIGESKWISFTTTLRDTLFLDRVRDLTGNVPGEGGLITFPDSGWRASIVIPHQPHFIGQPKGVSVFWGYGLAVDKLGDFVKKPMSECTGAEIMVEILGHLRLAADAPEVLRTSTCIPCMMPFITSQFLRRAKGDRPNVVPKGAKNFALMGQFCELPDDVVFTVEYSIRSAQTAVQALLGLRTGPPPVYKGEYDPRVLFRAFRALHDLPA